MREACDHSSANRIAHRDHYNRNSLGRYLGSLGSGRARCNDDVYWDAGEFPCGFCELGGLAFIGPKFILTILTFAIPEVTHGVVKVMPIRRGANHADKKGRPFRGSRKRPSDSHATEKGDELASPHGAFPLGRGQQSTTSFLECGGLCRTAKPTRQCPLWVNSGHMRCNGWCPL